MQVKVHQTKVSGLLANYNHTSISCSFIHYSLEEKHLCAPPRLHALLPMKGGD